MISVIIPVLNEAAGLALLLAQLSREPSPHEIIVVDGGSLDGSLAVARAHGTRWARSAPGRGQQIVRGADLARGDVLLFLHADCCFPAGGLAAIEGHLAARGDCPGGNFRLHFDGKGPFCRWLDGFYAWIRSHGFYYGDSGIFVRRGVYDALGGLRPIALMEDYDFVRRLERLGPTGCLQEPALVTSGRRFQGRRPWAIVSGWLLIHALFHLGVPPGWLAWLYNSKRRSRSSVWRLFYRREETSS